MKIKVLHALATVLTADFAKKAMLNVLFVLINTKSVQRLAKCSAQMSDTRIS